MFHVVQIIMREASFFLQPLLGDDVLKACSKAYLQMYEELP
jgi:hypothetical protein